MNFPMGGSLAALLVAAVAAGMTCILLLRKDSNSLHRTLGGLLGATALANFANGVGLVDEAHALFWRKIAMLGELAQRGDLFGQFYLERAVEHWRSGRFSFAQWGFLARQSDWRISSRKSDIQSDRDRI